jgi:hypothetical protein
MPSFCFFSGSTFFKDFFLAGGAFFFFVGMEVTFMFGRMRKNQNMDRNMAVLNLTILALYQNRGSFQYSTIIQVQADRTGTCHVPHLLNTKSCLLLQNQSININRLLFDFDLFTISPILVVSSRDPLCVGSISARQIIGKMPQSLMAGCPADGKSEQCTGLDYGAAMAGMFIDFYPTSSVRQQSGG